MPLKECRECGGKVSSLATTCPHCGIASPVEQFQGERIHNRITGWIWFFVIVAGAVLFFRVVERHSPPDQEATAQPSARPVPKPFDDANRELSQCLMPEAQYGRYSSFDGGKSAEKLLEEKCTTQYLAFVESCEGNDGSEDQKKKRIVLAAIAAQGAIKQFGK
jgi:hypothetical protein